MTDTTKHCPSCEALRRKLDALCKKLQWQTDWENMPNEITFEIKYNDGRIFIVKNEMIHVEFYKKRGFGWREIPELPELPEVKS